MTYHSPNIARALVRRPLPSGRRRPAPKLKAPPPPPAPTAQARALWRFEIWSNPTSPKGGSKLVYWQNPMPSSADEIHPVIALHKTPGTHARIWRQRLPYEASPGAWVQVNDPPGSAFDLEPVSGLGVTIDPSYGAPAMLLPPCAPQEIKTWAQSQCTVQAPHGYDTLGQFTITPVMLNPQTFNWGSAPVCAVAQLPVCAPPAGGSQPGGGGQQPGDEDGGEGDKSESTGLIIGGIILLAALGGGYAYYKSRKK